MTADSFAPFQSLYAGLAPFLETSTDGSHDLSHIQRVWQNAKRIAASEGGDLRRLAAAVLLHDCVEVPKNSPLRSQASRLAAERASEILRHMQWDDGDIVIVADAILRHSFSAGLVPESLEACILQDADRLDAIGAVGIARCFYTAGRMGSKMYDAGNPEGQGRTLDDRAYALDHFPLKLLRLADGFQTSTGAKFAAERHAQLEAFYRNFLVEVSV